MLSGIETFINENYGAVHTYKCRNISHNTSITVTLKLGGASPCLIGNY